MTYSLADGVTDNYMVSPESCSRPLLAETFEAPAVVSRIRTLSGDHFPDADSFPLSHRARDHGRLILAFLPSAL